MKSVHVITRHFIANYGSLLQSLASVKIFEELGYNAEIINYISKRENILGKTNTDSANFSKNPIKRVPFWLLKLPDEIVKTKRFNKLRKKYLKQTPLLTSMEQLKTYPFNGYLCAGSDQLWGFMPNKAVDPAYFLEFADESKTCFAYSASFGRTDFDENYYQALNGYLKKFSFITVREQSGVELIKTHTPYSAEHVLDPTLTVSREFWLDFANKPIKSKPYLLIYHLRRNKCLERYAKRLAKQNGWKIIRISTSIYDVFKQGKCKLLKDPETMLSCFKNAQCVVTDSFHATVFSLLFNKPFINVLPATTHERITDLLKLVGLENRALVSGDNLPLDLATEPIDYTKINAVLETERNRSLELLKNHLLNLEN